MRLKGPWVDTAEKETKKEKKNRRSTFETYIGMTQGTMSLQAATESGYPQS